MYILFCDLDKQARHSYLLFFVLGCRLHSRGCLGLLCAVLLERLLDVTSEMLMSTASTRERLWGDECIHNSEEYGRVTGWNDTYDDVHHRHCFLFLHFETDVRAFWL
jgi:hypothetical protein